MRFDEFKLNPIAEALLFEVSMSPKTLQQWAASPAATGIKMGFEFEVIVPNASNGDDNELEPDYDQDRRIRGGIDDIIDFFSNDDWGVGLYGRGADLKREEIYEKYREWEYEALDSYMDNNSDEVDEIIRGELDNAVDFDECMAEAEEELGEDADVTAITKRANEIRDEKIDEIMSDRDSREWQHAWDVAFEQMSSDFYSEDHSQEWLDDQGIRYMSDAHSEFGLDWPVWTGGGSGEVSIDQVASDFMDAGFQNVRAGSGYHSVLTDRSSSWVIEPDGSLEAEDGDGGLEFVSPALPLPEALDALTNFMNWADSYGCYTGLKHETGLHINISVPNFDIEKLDYIKLALFMGDQYVLEQFDRIGNGYAKSALSIIKSKVRDNPDNVLQLLDSMRSHLTTAASKLIHTGRTDKYTSINTKEGYVEFRGPGGDYLKKSVEELTNTSLRLAMALQIACDENAYRDEYAKKLYKILNPETEAEGNTISLFTKYVNNEITKSTLINFLRQTQAARAVKKLPPDAKKVYQVWRTSNPMMRMEIIARNEESAIQRAQLQNTDWARLRDDQFSVRVLRAADKELPASGTPVAGQAGEAQPIGRPRVPGQLPTYWYTLISNIRAMPLHAINDARYKLANDSADLSDIQRDTIKNIIEQELDRRSGTSSQQTSGVRDYRVSNMITRDTQTVRALSQAQAQEIAARAYGGTPTQWQVFPA